MNEYTSIACCVRTHFFCSFDSVFPLFYIKKYIKY